MTDDRRICTTALLALLGPLFDQALRCREPAATYRREFFAARIVVRNKEVLNLAQ